MAISDVEISRRFPEVFRITDTELRFETMQALRQVPDYFWSVPASSSKKYHNPYGRMEHGLWIHVKMAYTALERFAPTFVQMGLLTEEYVDYGRAAILLHDMFKQGHYSDWLSLPPDERHTVTDHDLIAAEWLLENTELPVPVLDAVAAHNGGWYDGPSPVDFYPEPETMWLCVLVHIADMCASSENITAGVWKPASEIADKYPTLPRASL